jgi:hypothetical protein
MHREKSGENIFSKVKNNVKENDFKKIRVRE